MITIKINYRNVLNEILFKILLAVINLFHYNYYLKLNKWQTSDNRPPDDM